MTNTHNHPIRVYYEDTDFSGLVYHASYLRFFERGRSEFLRNVGINHLDLLEQNAFFAVHHMDITFSRPAQMDDQLDVETTLQTVKGARLVMQQILKRAQETLVTATVTVAFMDKTGKPKRVDGDLLATLRARLSP